MRGGRVLMVGFGCEGSVLIGCPQTFVPRVEQTDDYHSECIIAPAQFTRHQTVEYLLTTCCKMYCHWAMLIEACLAVTTQSCWRAKREQVRKRKESVQ